jgi:glycine/D-amino acid oxidase-like deaminating enzyme
MVIPELKKSPAGLRKSYGDLGARMAGDVELAFDHVESVVSGADGRGGIDCDYSRSGQLYLAHSPRHVPALEQEAAERRAAGEQARFIPRDELRSEVGTDVYFGALQLDRTGGLHPAKFHAGLAVRAIASGAEVADRTSATGVRRTGSGFVVSTTRGTVSCRDVLLATNAYADSAVPALAARVQPISSFIIATQALPTELAQSVSPTGRMMFDTKNFLFYWRLTPDGRIAFGGRRSLDPVDVQVARDFLYDSMVRVHPQLSGVAIDFAWGGSIAATVDRMPHVGRIDGAWYATGCNGSGVALNTWLGHRLGATICGAAPPPSFAELPHRAVPLRGWTPAYLPVLSRWFAFQDRR